MLPPDQAEAESFRTLRQAKGARFHAVREHGGERRTRDTPLQDEDEREGENEVGGLRRQGRPHRALGVAFGVPYLPLSHIEERERRAEDPDPQVRPRCLTSSFGRGEAANEEAQPPGPGAR